MAAVTIAPSDEACQALVTQINAGTVYALQAAVSYASELIDDLEADTPLSVDVIHESQVTLSETLDVENATSHKIRIWVREKLPDRLESTVAARRLFFRQIFQRVLNFNSANGRVKVWECDQVEEAIPDKDLLREHQYFRADMLLRVEVDAA